MTSEQERIYRASQSLRDAISARFLEFGVAGHSIDIGTPVSLSVTDGLVTADFADPEGTMAMHVDAGEALALDLQDGSVFALRTT